MLLRKALQLLVIMLLPAFAMAQVTTSSISGKVVTASGAPLDGASIKVVHTPSGTVYNTISRENGLFDLQGLRVGGPYVLEVNYVGMVPQKVEDITLRLGETYDLKIDMQDASGNNTDVTVHAQVRKGASLKTGAGTIITTKQLSELPSISRSITDFTRLTPQSNGTSFGGRDGRYNNLQVDGANLNNNFGLSSDLTPGGGSPISLDALDEVSVNIAPYDVRQSGFTGAGINVVTKSGTNEFHGTAYGFYRNQNFYGYKVVGIGDDPSDAANYGQWIYEGQDGKPVNYSSFGHSFEDKKVIGNGLPKYYLSWNNNFQYKNWDLSITQRGAFKFQIANLQRMMFENPTQAQYNLLKNAYDPVFGKAVLKSPVTSSL